MQRRADAFNRHIEWWKKANAANLADQSQEPRAELVVGAAAAAWNAALSWAAEQIGEKKD
jgi:hypothetical protein